MFYFLRSVLILRNSFIVTNSEIKHTCFHSSPIEYFFSANSSIFHLRYFIIVNFLSVHEKAFLPAESSLFVSLQLKFCSVAL